MFLVFYSKCPFCHHDQGRSGHHATVCKVNGDLSRRHNTIRNTIFCMASQAARSTHLENHTFCLVSSGNRPIFMFPTGLEVNL